jgi:hypothetical protein
MESYMAPGPVFEPGPGWGGQLKKWSKKYILGGDCALCRATRYVLVFGVVVLIMAWPQLNQPTRLVGENQKIVETVQPKDGKTQLARRILARYLSQNANPKLSNGQKVFVETILKEKIPDQAVKKIGSPVELSYDEIEKALGQAALLSSFQLKRWEAFSQKVSF